jgi:hypothetical protein
MPSAFKLRFGAQEVEKWSVHYVREIDAHVLTVGAAARARGYLKSDDLRVVARWKTPRSASRIARNDDKFVRDVTRVALSTPSERLRIEVLTLLDGVNWPTASVILHFAHREQYPILDYRALWSVGVSPAPRYTFEFWQRYVAFARDAARRLKVSMRDLDRALWQYSKERQE